ncbi:MAG: hypothetical protein KJ000_12480 [Pirellulaceae bacterium]|nr:hypothetical protein [Pirellulaceae bacterium]
MKREVERLGCRMRAPCEHPVERNLFRSERNEFRSTLVAAALLLACTPAAMAEEQIHLHCEPRTFRVVPGEPVRLELTVEADSAAAVRLHIPADPLLRLRAVEKRPVRQAGDGTIVHQRVVIWQALEPGTIKMDAISMETQGRKGRFPEITITVGDPEP